jgi:hypothetical protein
VFKGFSVLRFQFLFSVLLLMLLSVFQFVVGVVLSSLFLFLILRGLLIPIRRT